MEFDQKLIARVMKKKTTQDLERALEEVLEPFVENEVASILKTHEAELTKEIEKSLGVIMKKLGPKIVADYVKNATHDIFIDRY